MEFDKIKKNDIPLIFSELSELSERLAWAAKAGRLMPRYVAVLMC